MNRSPDFYVPPLRRILIVNDDGIHSAGLACLERCARALSDHVRVVAPEHERSGNSRAITLGMPLRVRDMGAERFITNGTPADCVLLGLHEVMQPELPDLVLSGINHGANIADDVTLSGTIGAALEARDHGIPAIAVSSDCTSEGQAEIAWDAIERRLPELILHLWAAFDEFGGGNQVIFNVNFPALTTFDDTAIRAVITGAPRIRKLIRKRIDPRDGVYYWVAFDNQDFPDGIDEKEASCDISAMRCGTIAVTPLHRARGDDAAVDPETVRRLNVKLQAI